jgi:hypothetical protein
VSVLDRLSADTYRTLPRSTLAAVAGRTLSARAAREAAARTAAWEAERAAAGWRYETEATLDGRFPLVEGRRFRVAGERGWWTFIRRTTNPTGESWIDAYDATGAYRSIDATRITRVERTRPDA